MAETMELNIHLSGTSEKDRVHEKLDSTINGGQNSSQQKTNKSAKASDTATKGASYAAVAAGAWAISQAKSLANSSVGYIANVYGDQAMANSVSNGMEAANKLIGMGTAIAGGAAVGGPWGAAIAAVLAVATEGVQMAQRAFEYTNTLQEKLQTTQRSAERLGLISTNGNR
jgi:hypothetical protein